jgi:signal transduction histidine kinase
VVFLTTSAVLSFFSRLFTSVTPLSYDEDMTTSASDCWTRIDEAGTAITAVFARPEEAARRAMQLAEVVRGLWPMAAFSACVLRDRHQTEVVVLDQNGQARPDLAEQFLATCIGKLLPSEISLSDRRFIVEPAAHGDRAFGALALSAESERRDPGPADRAVLSACGQYVALHRALEEREREVESLRLQLVEETALSAIGEMAGPVVHEFNNLLNTILLQIAVMEQKVDASLLPDLHTIRRQGAGVIALVKRWQQCRRRPAEAQPVLDVNAFIEEIATADPAVTTMLAPHLPALRGTASDFRRLICFLVKNARAVSDNAVVRTESAGDAVVLRVEDSGPAVPPEMLPRLFQPLGEGRTGTNLLELAACGTLVRRFQGKLKAENRPTGGLAVIVHLPGERV